MFSHERLKVLRQASGFNQSAVARHLNVSRAAYSSWEKGTYVPNKAHLIALATLFNTSVQAFERHSDLLATYDKLTPFHQQKLKTYAGDLYRAQLIPYRVHAKLSAGIGDFYDEHDEPTTTHYFDKAIAHDVASWIDGDSMEPDYHNGDVALIRLNGFDYDGLVYAVGVGELIYLKKVYRHKDTLRLVSINSQYDDIVVPIEEARIFGQLVGSFTPIEVG